MAWLSLFAVLVLVLGVYVGLVRPPLRERRLGTLRRELRHLRDLTPGGVRTPAQRALAVQLDALEALERRAREAELRARALALPCPALAQEREDADAVLKRVVAAFEAPHVQLAAAGGEAFAAHLLDLLQPDALERLAATGKALTEPGALNILLQGGAVGAAQAAGERLAHGALEVLKHGGSIADVAALPAQMAQSLKSGAAGLGAVLGKGEAAFHFPVLTLLLASIREGSLFFDEKTSLERALGHVALDTAATAAGGLGGAKLGAIVGSLVAPGLGTAVGTVMGAAIGGMGGKSLANELKARPLRQALEKYRAAFAAADAELRTSAAALCERLHAQGLKEQARYDKAMPGFPELEAHAPRNLPILAEAAHAYALQVLDAHAARIVALRDDLLARLEEPGLVDRALGLDVREEATGLVGAAASEVLARVAEARGLLEARAPGLVPAHAVLRGLATAWLPAAGFEPGTLSRVCDALDALQDAYPDALRAWSDGVARAFRRGVQRLSDALAEEAERHGAEVQRCGATLKRRAAVVRREQRALGLDG